MCQNFQWKRLEAKVIPSGQGIKITATRSDGSVMQLFHEFINTNPIHTQVQDVINIFNELEKARNPIKEASTLTTEQNSVLQKVLDKY